MTPTLELPPSAVSGTTCYPGSTAPPINLYLQNTTTKEEFTVAMEQGETAFDVELPPGEYTAYAATVGTEVWGGYTAATVCQDCAGEELRPFVIKPNETTTDIDLCDWDHHPGFWPPDVAGEKEVTVTTVQNTNLYPNPSLANEPLIVIPPRTTGKAVARTADNNWLQIKIPTGDSLWLYGRLVQIKGDFFSIPIFTPNEAGVQDSIVTERPLDQFVPQAWFASENESIVHFRGFIRDEQGKPVNGFSVLFDNGTWSVLSHPSGASRHYPDTDDGEWDLVITNASDATGWWALTVVSYDCPDFEASFNAQCKEFTPLSETQIIRVVYPDDNVIHADWVCLKDCDRGLYVEAYRRPSQETETSAEEERLRAEMELYFLLGFDK